MNSLKLRSDYAHWLNALNCSCFGVTIALLAVHFVYRFFAVCRPQSISMFSFPNSLIWLIFCATITIIWYTTTQIYSSRNPELDQLINFSLLKTYNILPNEIVYHGSYYYNLDSSVNIQNTLITIGVNCMSSGCLLIILICGTKTNIKMKTRRTVSKKFDDLQRQLFRALVIQTIIPFFTMFLPASLILILPIFKITLGSSELLIMVFITTYPLIDPLIVLYIVKDYRKTIFRFVKCVKKNRAIQSSSIIVSNKL